MEARLMLCASRYSDQKKAISATSSVVVQMATTVAFPKCFSAFARKLQTDCDIT